MESDQRFQSQPSGSFPDGGDHLRLRICFPGGASCHTTPFGVDLGRTPPETGVRGFVGRRRYIGGSIRLESAYRLERRFTPVDRSDLPVT